jgi:hypothetical protein
MYEFARAGQEFTGRAPAQWCAQGISCESWDSGFGRGDMFSLPYSSCFLIAGVRQMKRDVEFGFHIWCMLYAFEFGRKDEL